MMKKIYSVLLAVFVAANSFAQQVSENATMEDDRSPIKGMTLHDFESYRDGKSMNFDRVAELNHYPGPANVLKSAKELKLNVNQQIQVKEINMYLQRKVLEMGRIIIEQEKKIDDLFSSGKIDNGSLIYHTQQYGLYQGELRNAHLQSHLKTRAVLSREQIKKYDEIYGH